MSDIAEWVERQLAKFPELTAERWAQIVAILRGAQRLPETDHTDRYDQSA
jgi:hypothetical protein